MTFYLPDAKVISYLMPGDLALAARVNAAQRGDDRFVLCPVVEDEVRRGILRRRALTRFGGSSSGRIRGCIPQYSRRNWPRAAELWTHSRAVGQPIAAGNLLIAAPAINLNALFITNNQAHFSVFVDHGLRMENWTVSLR